MNKLDDQKLTVRYKDRDPDPGECRVISINWETRKLRVSNGACRFNPYFDEVEIVHITLTQENKEDFSTAHLCARRIMDNALQFMSIPPIQDKSSQYVMGLTDALTAMVEFGFIKSFDVERNIIEPVMEEK